MGPATERDRWIPALLVAMVALNLLGLTAFLVIALNSSTRLARLEGQMEAIRERSTAIEAQANDLAQELRDLSAMRLSIEDLKPRVLLNETWVRTHSHPEQGAQPTKQGEEKP